MNLLQLSAIVHDKASSVSFLQQRGILHRNRLCVNGHNMHLSLSDSQDRWRCKLQGCRMDYALRSGTWLQGSKLPYREIILFIYCWSHEMTSIKFCERELLLNHNTIVDYNNYLREICAFTLLNNPVVIGGHNQTVEIDETLISRRKNHVGRILPQQWVFGGICRETNECFMYLVPDRSANTLLPIIRDSIRPGTTIMSDLWASYGGIRAMGFQHLTVNHSLNFVDPITGAHTQKIESNWNKAKARHRKHFGTARGMIDGYMCEYMWRKRNIGNNLFDQILVDITLYWPPV